MPSFSRAFLGFEIAFVFHLSRLDGFFINLRSVFGGMGGLLLFRKVLSARKQKVNGMPTEIHDSKREAYLELGKNREAYPIPRDEEVLLCQR